MRLPATYLGVLALLTVTGFAAVTMGLAISAGVTTEDQAMSFIPLALIPQLLFAGAIVPVIQMSATGRVAVTSHVRAMGPRRGRYVRST